MKTYTQWIGEGRQVRQGQKASHYLVSPDDTSCVALFTEDQTEATQDTTDWIKVVPADERPTLKKKPPTVKIDHDALGIWVWVGSDRKAIERLRSLKFRFQPGVNRWTRPGADPHKLVKIFADAGYVVEHDLVEPAPSEPAGEKHATIEKLEGGRAHLVRLQPDDPELMSRTLAGYTGDGAGAWVKATRASAIYESLAQAGYQVADA